MVVVCYNPQLNFKECNEKHCNQQYIDHYAACQCRRIAIDFYEVATFASMFSVIGDTITGGFINPYGNSTQYRPGEGTATFTKTTDSPVATRIYDGTTYYGGQTTVISGSTRIVSATAIVGQSAILPGTTTWVSGIPGIIRGTSTLPGPQATGAYTVTRYVGGTTYYGGVPTVISGSTCIVSATAVVRGTTILPGTTTWVSGTPGIIRGTSTPSSPRPAVAIRYYNGTTYYGGHASLVSGTTRIVRATAIVNGTWIAPGTTTWVSGSHGSWFCDPYWNRDYYPHSYPHRWQWRYRHRLACLGTFRDPDFHITQGIPGGAIVGIVLGIFGTAILAALLALCWRKKREAHIAALSSTHIAHEPARTTVFETIEPVVVKPVPAAETYRASNVPIAGRLWSKRGSQ
ncbi:hypothetical protein BG006_003945 [Podila minutissima]|uniref:Uncharacterized protein n=1 Tax=Podila minutissima TaxID=64525 RepID=A0A9P5VN27_9FUNG|nr:hypothetical protein BG006_003945 [Podila minutissima]